MTVALGRIAEVNPPVPEFSDEADSPVTFVPLECVWADGRADFTRRRPANEVSTGYTLFRRGDVLVPKITPTFEAGRVAVADIPTEVGAGTTELHIVRPRSDVDARFLAYVLRSQPFLQDGATRLQGVGNLRRVPAEFLEKFPVAISDSWQQRAIADYLDRETAQIDTLIAEQQRLRGILQERRARTIATLIAHGTRSTSSMKPSGLFWAPEVPEHWTVAHLSRFASMRTGHTPSRSTPEYWVDCDVPWFTLADVWQLRSGRSDYLGETSTKISQLGLDNSSAELLPAGTVVLSRTASVGYSGVMPIPMATSQDFWNWIPGPSLDSKYLLWVLRAMRPMFDSLMAGSTHKTIYQADASALRIPLPPLGEQVEIAALLNEVVTRLDVLDDESQQFVELSTERRAALITAAVTGQIDIGSTA